MQNGLENRARKAYETYQKTGELEALEIFQAIDNDMRILGIEGQVAPGVKIGRAMPIDEKLAGLMINAMDKGILTQKEVNQAITAANKIAKAKKDYEKMFKEKATFQSGGLVREVDDIFDEEDELKRQTRSIFPRISVEFGDAAKGVKRSFGEEKPEEEVFNLEQKTTAAPMQKTFDVQPMEDIFEGEVEASKFKITFLETIYKATCKRNSSNTYTKRKFR